MKQFLPLFLKGAFKQFFMLRKKLPFELLLVLLLALLGKHAFSFEVLLEVFGSRGLVHFRNAHHVECVVLLVAGEVVPQKPVLLWKSEQ